MSSARIRTRAFQPNALTIVRLALLVGFAFSVLTVFVAVRLPSLDVRLRVQGDRIVADWREGPSAVVAIRSSAGSVEFVASDLIEEPDILPTWAEFNRFFGRQDRLMAVLAGTSVELLRQDGAPVEVATVKRGVLKLPWQFYMQSAAALLVWLIGLAAYAFSDRAVGARAYAVSAVSIALAIWPAAIYSTRALAVDAHLFRALSWVDHAAGLVYSVATLRLFATYPTPIPRRTRWLWATVPVGFVLEQGQIFDKASFDFYTCMLFYVGCLVVLATWQWFASRKNPVSRAAYSWILLSVALGMGGFVLLVDVPMWLGLAPLASQAVALSAFVVLYAGISLGVLKLRLFELDRWWFRTWSWCFGGVLVIGLDLVLMSAFEMSSRESLLVTLALVGWLYFPMRQWLLARLTRRKRPEGFDVARLVSARDSAELSQRFREGLGALFAPLSIEHRPEPIGGAHLGSFGETLLAPAPAQRGHYVCHLRNDGKDLFSREDVQQAERAVAISAAAHRAIQAREEGEQAERARIRRDLHDDMGASIIRIIHASEDSKIAALAKAAMRDLRNVLMALSQRPAKVEDVLEDLQAELTHGVDPVASGIAWQVEGHAGWELSARERTNVVRTVREATTNALKHGVGQVSYRFILSEHEFAAVLANETNGRASPTQGLGLSNIRARMQELGGTLEVVQEADQFSLRLRLPRGALA